MGMLPVHVNTDALLVGPDYLSVLVPSAIALDQSIGEQGADEAYQKRSCSQV